MKVVLAAALMLLLVADSTAAQSAAELVVSTVDQTGAPLPGVRLTIRGATDRTATTGATGDFAFPGLPGGDYEISAELSRFQREVRAVRVEAGERLTVSLTLQVGILEEAVVVTAGKAGERNVQTTPLAVSAVSDAELERLGARTLFQSAALAPSVTLSQNTNSAQLTIRGIGTNVVNAGSDPSSAIYLDGVYLARPAMAFVQFLDLERIEVLRGPQGTLYGRNAVGGAINLISKPPTNDLHASADLTVGNFQQLRGSARVSGPLVRDRVMGSVSFARGAQDGYVRDLDHPDHPLGGDDVTTARGQVRAVFDRRTSLLLSTDVDDQNGVPLTFNKALAVKPGFQIDNPPDLHDVRASVEGFGHTRQFGASARLTTALTPSTTLVSLTGYRTLDYEFFVESDTSELDVLITRQQQRQHQLSEEMTISHERPGLSWVGGVFLFDEYEHQSFWSGQLVPQLETRLDPRVDATSRAFFGQATIGLTSRVSATAGLRYTREGKDIDNAGGRYGIDPPFAAVPGSVYGYSDSIGHDAWTPKVGIEVKLPHDAFAYASATRGFKSGGFNLSSPVAGRGYAPEWAWSYEGGLKGTLMDGRARFTVAGFFTDYTNLQVQTPIGIAVFDIRNAAAATIRGVEVEHTSRFGRGFEAGGHVTWLDATYDNYIAVDNLNVAGDVSGKRLNNAPEWAGRLWVEWSGDIGPSRRLSIVADTTAQSTVYYTPFNDNIQFQGPYGVLGARVEYGPTHRRWALAAYARNLTNTDYVTATFGTSPVAFGGRPGPSRQFALNLSVRR